MEVINYWNRWNSDHEFTAVHRSFKLLWSNGENCLNLFQLLDYTLLHSDINWIEIPQTVTYSRQKNYINMTMGKHLSDQVIWHLSHFSHRVIMAPLKVLFDRKHHRKPLPMSAQEQLERDPSPSGQAGPCSALSYIQSRRNAALLEPESTRQSLL